MENPSGRDVLVMHGLVEALWDRRLRTVGEHELKESFLKGDFSYIALGHYHGQARVANNAWYSGSVEYFRFSEAGDEKGLLLVDLDSGDVEQIPVMEKYMLDLDPVDCGGLSSREIEEAVAAICDDACIRDKIVRLRLKDASREAYRSLSQRLIGEMKNQALHLEILPEFKDDPAFFEAEPMDSKRLPQEFKKFVEGEAARDGIPAAIKEDVVSYGTDLMARISEKRTTESFDAPQ
jgi:DNA repair exonuclease SbcCD nuclease subunit